MDPLRVAIIIPALNEEASIEGVVRGVSPWGTPVVVDDGSSDRTGDLSVQAGALMLRHPAPRGYDAALETGFAWATRLGFRYAITFDADGQHDSSVLPEFVSLLTHGHDVVIGVRPRFARISESLFAAYTRSWYGVRDPLCGLKGYSLRLYAQQGHFDSYRSIGTELMLYAVRNGRSLAQVRVEIAPRHGTSGFGGSLRGNWRIARALGIALISEGRAAAQRGGPLRPDAPQKRTALAREILQRRRHMRRASCSR